MRGWRLLRLLPIVFLLLFYFFPLGRILDISLRPGGILDLSGFVALVRSERYRDVIAFTLGQALLSTALTLLLALPGAYVFTQFRFPGRSMLMALSMLPFVLPTVVVAAALTALLGEDGPVNALLMQFLHLPEAPIQFERSLGAIIIAHVVYNYAIALRMIGSYWANQSPHIEAAARTLGANGLMVWWLVRLPLLRPAILASALLVFIFSFTSFGIVLILGGLAFATVEVEIQYQVQVVGVPGGLPMAAALSVLQIGIMFLMMILYTRLQRDMVTDVQSADRAVRRPRGTAEKLLVGANVVLLLVLTFAPPVALLWQAVVPEAGAGLTLSSINNLLTDAPQGRLNLPLSASIGVAPLQAIANSLRYALMTTAAALFLGLLTAYLLAGRRRSRWLDSLAMLPLATSAVTLGFGFVVALDFDPMRQFFNTMLRPIGGTIPGDWDLRTSEWLIPIAHTLVALPFVVRSVLPSLRRVPMQTLQAASVLGAAPVSAWFLVELPLIGRGLVVGASFAFTVSMGEFGASLLISRPGSATIPIAVERLLGRPGTLPEAYAMSAILMLICAVAFLLIERIRTAGVGEF